MTRRFVYAYICDACDHPSSEHLDTTGERTYACGRCGCVITLDSPQHGVTKSEYQARYAPKTS